MRTTEHIPKTAWDEPHLMKNMVISQKAPFLKTLRYIFLTEWQLCAKRVDHGSRSVPRAPSNRQLIAHMDPRVPKTEAKLLAQIGVLVVLLPFNKGICHFSWQEQDCSVSLWTNGSIYDPRSNTGRFISATMILGGPSACQRQHWRLGATELMLTEVRARAGHVWTGDKVKRWNPSGSRLETEERGSQSDKWSLMWQGLSPFW